MQDTPIRPKLLTAVAVGGLSQPLVDIAAVLSLQGYEHHAKSVCEAAWLVEKVAQMPEVLERLKSL